MRRSVKHAEVNGGVGSPRGQSYAIWGSRLPRGLKRSIAQQPVTNSRHSDQEVWCVIGNVAMGEIKSIPVIHCGHARVNSGQSCPWGESPAPHWPLPFLSVPSLEAIKSQVTTGSEQASHTMLIPKISPPPLISKTCGKYPPQSSTQTNPECEGPWFVLLSTLIKIRV